MKCILFIILSSCFIMSCNISRDQLVKQANQYIVKKQYQDAELILNKLLEQNPNLGYVYNLRARVNILQNNIKNAFDDYNKALNLNKYDAESLSGLALLYYKLKDRKKAEWFLNLALKYEPEKEILNFNMFQLLFNSNRKKEGQKYLKNTLSFTSKSSKKYIYYKNLFTKVYGK